MVHHPGRRDRSPTPRTRRRSTRTSTRSTSTTTPRASTRRCCGSSGTGWTTGCGSSGSTTRTPSRCAFWERLLGEIRGTDPDVLFLAEAFTRPAMMHALAKIGFHQSYTYFTWRNAQAGARGVPRASCPATRPPTCGRTSSSTPRTSCTSTCSTAGRPAFKIRAVLAAMLSPDLGRLLRLRAVRARRRSGRAARSTWTRRSTSTARATGRRPAEGRHRWTPLPHRAQPDPARPPGPAAAAQPALPRTSTSQDSCCFSKRVDATPGHAGRYRAGRRQPRPAPAPGRPRSGSTCPRSAWTGASSSCATS